MLTVFQPMRIILWAMMMKSQYYFIFFLMKTKTDIQTVAAEWNLTRIYSYI